jgi:hypothetical protein
MTSLELFGAVEDDANADAETVAASTTTEALVSTRWNDARSSPSGTVAPPVSAAPASMADQTMSPSSFTLSSRRQWWPTPKSPAPDDPYR